MATCKTHSTIKSGTREQCHGWIGLLMTKYWKLLLKTLSGGTKRKSFVGGLTHITCANEAKTYNL